MNRWRRIGVHGAIAVGLMVLPAIPVAAEDEARTQSSTEADQAETQERAQEQPVLKSAAPAKTGSSLADAASKIRLQTPAQEGGLVISNHTLQKPGAMGTLSVGGGVSAATGSKTSGTTSAAGAKQGAPGSDNPLNALVQQYHEQLAVVQGLEARLEKYDEQLAEPARDPHYPYVTNRPQDRAPGVQDPAKGQRDLLAARLDEERKKLDGIREQARRAGVKLQ
jgi:hypothetical protein